MQDKIKSAKSACQKKSFLLFLELTTIKALITPTDAENHSYRGKHLKCVSLSFHDFSKIQVCFQNYEGVGRCWTNFTQTKDTPCLQTPTLNYSACTDQACNTADKL